MFIQVKCILCENSAEFFFETARNKYYQCNNCSGIFMDPKCYLSNAKERERYLEHNNDVDDLGYQEFVKPVVSRVQGKFNTDKVGLDYGSGTGPVAATLLGKKGYKIELYDPFFHNHKETLNNKYDFIICCEVIEHFHFPNKEFALLKSLLKPEGELICMTQMYSDEINMKDWKYKDDQTHVFFYSPETFQWIKSQHGFSNMQINGRLIVFGT